MGITSAEQYEENEQYDKAYEEYKSMYSKNSKNLDILERLGHVALILDKKDEAAEYYHMILELDPSNTVAYEQLMDIYVHTDRFKYYISRGNLHVLQEEISHAIGDFKKALDKAQSTEEANSTRFVLATLYEQTGKNHNAIDEYLRILDTSAVNELVFLKLAQAYINEDSISSAIGILERARENGFDTENIKENLAQLYLKNDQPDKAREFTNDDLVKIRALLDEGKNKEAFGLLENIKASNKTNPQYHSLLAQYYFNEKKWEESLNSVAEFDNLQKNSPLTYQMRALIYEEKGNNFDSHINWAKYNLAKQDKDVALNEYMSAYQYKDNDAVLVRNIAELLEDLGDKNQSSEFWEKLVALDPKNMKALEKLADFKAHIGDHRSEAEILEKLYAIDNKNSIVVKKLAQAYEKIKNKNKALEFYNIFLKISPVNDDYEQIKSKISKLENVQMEEDEGLLGKIMGLFAKK